MFTHKKRERLRLAAFALGLLTATAAAGADSSLVAEIGKAPIVPDGDVAGAATDVVIELAVDPDPAVPGLTLAKGESIRVTLPDAFVFADSEGCPVEDFLGAPHCAPDKLACSTLILLQGWPQEPILPSFPPGEKQQYSIDYDPKDNAFTLTAAVALDDVPMEGPGLKQIHLALLGFRNPDEPGDYPIGVSIRDAEGNARAAGTGVLTIRPTVAPSLNLASVFDDNGGAPPNPNTIYQTANTNAPTPLPWDFLVWDGAGEAYDGLEVRQLSPTHGALVHKGETVGAFTIDAPPGAMGQHVTGGPSIALPREPVFDAAIPTGRLTLHFTAGSKSGRYVTTFALAGGDSVRMTVDAVTDGQK